MLANTTNPQQRRKSAALEVMLSSLETAGDLLSGSECSSPATSPVHEEVFTFRPQSSEQQHGREEKSPRGQLNSEPVNVVRKFLNHTIKPHLAKELIAEDTKVECHSVMVGGEDKKEQETIQAAQRDLDKLLASCARCDIEIDGIFACGEDVAAFGHSAYLDGPSSLPRNVRFSIWACVDVAREKIVGFRWLDQIARAEDECVDRRR